MINNKKREACLTFFLLDFTAKMLLKYKYGFHL